MNINFKTGLELVCVILFANLLKAVELVRYEFNPDSDPPYSRFAPRIINSVLQSASDIATTTDFVVSSSSGTAFIRAIGTGADLPAAISGGDYLEFSITPALGTRISLESFVFDHEASNTTVSPYESSLSIFVSTNGFATPPVPGEELGTSTVMVDAGIGINPSMCADDVVFPLDSIGYTEGTNTLSFRVYSFDDSAGNECITRIDDIRIVAMGAIESVTTTPEFSSGDQSNDVWVTSFSLGGYTYSNLTAASGVAGSPNSSREYLWGAAPDAIDPGTNGTTFAEHFESAVIDQNLATGSLNGGSGAIYQFLSSSGRTRGIQSNDLVYAFINDVTAVPVFFVAAVNSVGADITDGLGFSTSRALHRFDFLRSSGPALDNRNVFGVAFKVADFIFDEGYGPSDIAGVRFGSSTLDIQDIGVTTINSPPSATVIVVQ